MALTTMVLFQAFHAGNSRSESRSVFRLSPFSNPFLLLAVAGALVVHAAALYLPFTRYVLRIEPLDAGAWGRMALVGLAIVAGMELHKLIRGGRSARERPQRVAA